MSFTGVTEAKKKLIGKIHLLREIPGFSAYELAVKHGFEGTEEEWLASLSVKGDPGTLESHTEIDALGNRVINVADPVEDTDGVNKRYVGEDISEDFVSGYWHSNGLATFEYFDLSAYKRGKLITVTIAAQLKTSYNTGQYGGILGGFGVRINERYLPNREYSIRCHSIEKLEVDIGIFDDWISVEHEYKENFTPQILATFSYFCK